MQPYNKQRPSNIILSKLDKRTDNEALSSSLSLFIWIFLIGLPTHTFLMMILFGKLGIPEYVVTFLSAWKELLVIIIIIFAVVQFIIQILKDRQFVIPVLSVTDKFIALFIIWIIIRCIISLYTTSSISLSIYIYGLRFYLIPVGLYTIGRIGLLRQTNVRRMEWVLVIIGGITGFLAIIEMILPDSIFIDLLRNIGYFTYYNDLIKQQAMYGPEGTSASMWILIGNRFVRRAGSIYLVSKPFAFSYLLIIPIALILLWTETQERFRRWLSLLLLFCWIGLLLSVTRAAIIVCLIVAFGLMIYYKRWITLITSISILLLITLVLLSSYSVRDYISRTLQAKDSSTLQHLQGWIGGLGSSRDHLFIGSGIGTANQELARLKPINNQPTQSISESIYVQTFQELGLIGLICYVGILLSLMIRTFKQVRQLSSYQVHTELIIAWTTLAIILISIFAIPWQGAFVITYFYWLLAGYVGDVA